MHGSKPLPECQWMDSPSHLTALRRRRRRFIECDWIRILGGHKPRAPAGLPCVPSCIQQTKPNRGSSGPHQRAYISHCPPEFPKGFMITIYCRCAVFHTLIFLTLLPVGADVCPRASFSLDAAADGSGRTPQVPPRMGLSVLRRRTPHLLPSQEPQVGTLATLTQSECGGSGSVNLNHSL